MQFLVVLFFDLCTDLLPHFAEMMSQINMSTCRPVEVVGRPFAESVACQVHGQGADVPCQGYLLFEKHLWYCSILVSYMQNFLLVGKTKKSM